MNRLLALVVLTGCATVPPRAAHEPVAVAPIARPDPEDAIRRLSDLDAMLLFFARSGLPTPWDKIACASVVKCDGDAPATRAQVDEVRPELQARAEQLRKLRSFRIRLRILASPYDVGRGGYPTDLAKDHHSTNLKIANETSPEYVIANPGSVALVRVPPERAALFSRRNGGARYLTFDLVVEPRTIRVRASDTKIIDVTVVSARVFDDSGVLIARME